MAADKIYPIPTEIAGKAHIDEKTYLSMYEKSISAPDEFWAEQANEFIDWYSPWKTVSSVDFVGGEIKWFDGATLNVSYNCLDRHIDTRGDQTAVIWEGDDPNEDTKLTYKELLAQVCQFANALKTKGVKKGDRVSIYMPMVPEAAIAMLACARIGAVHSIVFGGFSPDALRDRIIDSDCSVVITADEGLRGAKPIPLKANTDQAIASCANVHTVFVIKRTGGSVDWDKDRDVWYHEAIATESTTCEPEAMDAEDPLFILYTSGSTGKPKGVLHTTGGYILYAAMTHKYVFDYHEGDI